MNFKKTLWKDGMENEQEKRKTLTVESVVPCVHKRVKNWGSRDKEGGSERGRGEEMKKWNGISRSLSAEP